MRPYERLREIAKELAEQRTELQILEEQLTFQAEIAEDARIRALVSETPLADREAQEAARDLALLQRSRGEALEREAALRAEQDALLEQILDAQR